MDANQRRELLAEVRQANNCSHPIRISGEMVNRQTGEVGRQGLTVACKDRRRAVCPTCSYLYKADAFILASAGLIGGKGIDESVVGHPRLFVTLTAPSFGPVHRIAQNGQCHRRRPRCPHGVLLHCSRRHTSDDSQLGSPLCFDCFDYSAAVEWNAHANRLWNHLITRIRREVAMLGGLSRSGLERHFMVSYFKVAEFQRRGLVHFHIVIRVDGPEGPNDSAPPWATPSALATVIRHCVTNEQMVSSRGDLLRWGQQLHIGGDSAEVESARVAGYLAKYAVKTTDGSIELARRFRRRDQMEQLNDRHQRTLALTAWDSGYQRHAHSYGYAGNLITKSRHYSTTFTRIRGERAAFMRPQNTLETVPGTFLYDGRGYHHPKAKELAELFFSMDVELRREAAERKGTSYTRSRESFSSPLSGAGDPENSQQPQGL